MKSFLNKALKAWPPLAVLGVITACIVSQASLVSSASLFITALSIVGILFVLGVAYQKPVSQLFGAGFCGMLAYASFGAGFFANAVVNGLVLVPLSILGYFLWKSRGSGGDIGRTMSSDSRGIFVGLGILVTLIVFMFTMDAGGALPVLDAITAVLPVAATFLMVNAYKEQWVCWILYNFLQAVMWASAMALNPAMMAVFVLKMIFLVNSLIGYYIWRQSK